MKKIKLCITISMMLITFSYGSSAQELPKLRIDLDRAYGGKFSDYLDSIEYIPLENSKEAQFGQVTNLIITDSSFVITDLDTRSVLFFSRRGKLIKRISSHGGLKASGAVHDINKNEINIAFENEGHTKVIVQGYSLEGNFKAELKLSRKDVDFIHNSIIVDENTYWIRERPTKFAENTDSHFFSQYVRNAKLNSAVPFDHLNRYSFYKLNQEIGKSNTPVIHAGKFYFSTPIDHKIYEVSTDKGESRPLFQVVFPAKFAINPKILNVQERKKVDSIVRKQWFAEKTVLCLENVVYDGSKLMFKTRTGYLGYYASDGSRTARNFTYDFKKSLLVAFEKISADSSTYFLPFNTPKILSIEGFYFKKGHLYTHISSLDMFSALAATKAKNAKYPEVLNEYFKSQNRKSNPVIVQMKLKKQDNL
jgi:hypothetical protein